MRSMTSRMAVLLALLSVLLLSDVVVSQQTFTNSTPLTGTWASGTGWVQTGSGFCNPTAASFSTPVGTGVSYSFTDDGHFEEAIYTHTGNGSSPRCITAAMLWQHGTYTFNANGSLSLTPIVADGRLQTANPCTSSSSLLQQYAVNETFSRWSISVDNTHQQYALQLVKFDGSLLQPLFLTYRPPNMLPTNQLSS